MRRALALFVGATLLAAFPAHALVLCSTKRGALRVREACRAKETQIDPAALGLQGPKGDPGDPATVARTVLRYNGSATGSGMPQSTYQLLRTVGEFTKARSDTDIELLWTGTATASGFVPESVCEYQLRIDGRDENGSLDTAFNLAAGGNVFVSTVDTFIRLPVAVSAHFSGLESGVHTVSIWVRNAHASVGCDDSNGNTGIDGQTVGEVLVREIP